MNKYDKLRVDLMAAIAAGEEAERNSSNDGGTCNMDSAVLILPRWEAKKVEQAAREAEVCLFKKGSGVYLVMPRTYAQGYSRTRNAESVCASLKAAGYNAGMWYQMD